MAQKQTGWRDERDREEKKKENKRNQTQGWSVADRKGRMKMKGQVTK